MLAGTDRALERPRNRKLPQRVEELLIELEGMTKNALRRRDYAVALRAVASRLQCLKVIGELSGELRSGPEELVPATGVAAAVQVNVTSAAPEEGKDPERLVRRICEVYQLRYPRGSKPPTLQ